MGDFLNPDRQSDLNRLVKHVLNTYGMGALLEQLIEVVKERGGLEPYEIHLVDGLQNTLDTYKSRYELSSKGRPKCRTCGMEKAEHLNDGTDLCSGYDP